MFLEENPRTDDRDCLSKESVQLGSNGVSSGRKGRSCVALFEPLPDVQKSPALCTETYHIKITVIPAL